MTISQWVKRAEAGTLPPKSFDSYAESRELFDRELDAFRLYYASEQDPSLDDEPFDSPATVQRLRALGIVS